MFFLVASIIADIRDYGKSCCNNIHKTFEIPKIQVALKLMIFLHFLHVCRLIYKLVDKLRRERKRFKG